MKIPPSDTIGALLVGERPDGIARRSSEDSLSSTLTVGPPTKTTEDKAAAILEPVRGTGVPTSSSAAIFTAAPTRCVSFDESHNTCLDNTLYAQEDALDHWYSNVELQQFKSAAAFMAKMIDRSENGHSVANFTSTASDSDSEARRDPLSYTGILETVYEACCELPEEDEMEEVGEVTETEPFVMLSSASILPKKVAARLKHLFMVEIGLGRLGLERRSVRLVNQEKNRRRNVLLEMVMYMDMDDTEELRRHCEQVSLPARQFAQHLAQAQWEAAVAPSPSL